MLILTIEVDCPDGTDPQGIKEALAVNLERVGSVRVTKVQEVSNQVSWFGDTSSAPFGGTFPSRGRLRKKNNT